MSVVQANKEQRVGVFIDIQNLYHSAKNLYGGRVNFDNLLKRLVNGRRLVRALGYVVKSDPATGEGAFFDALNKAGIELRIKDIQIFPDGMKKADWDVGLAVDAIRMASLVDVVIIVSGDGDFIPLVEYLKWGLGRTVEVAAFDRTASSKLEDTADSFIDLGKTPGVVFKVFKKAKKQ
ncbi:MAG: NYN domain-containing protein [Patescibacteria group bacterium]